jgi:hypothetical protein
LAVAVTGVGAEISVVGTVGEATTAVSTAGPDEVGTAVVTAPAVATVAVVDSTDVETVEVEATTTEAPVIAVETAAGVAGAPLSQAASTINEVIKRRILADRKFKIVSYAIFLTTSAPFSAM